MTTAMPLDGVEEATGRTWDAWCTVLDGWDAAALSHAAIARRLQDDEGVAHWWAQTLTVAYEQHIGRRVPGQASDGTYQISASRTVDGKLDDAFARWLQVVADLDERTPVGIAREPATTANETYRYWRVGFADGSRVTFGASQVKPGKVKLGVGHQRLPAPDDIERWRPFWKALLAEL